MLIYLLSTAAVCSAAENMTQKQPFSVARCQARLKNALHLPLETWRDQGHGLDLMVLSNLNDSVTQKEHEVREAE